MPEIASILDEHAGEAARLFRTRSLAATSPGVTLDGLARLDGRLAAHLAGLRRAGPSAWSAVAEVLTLDRPEHVFVVAALALEAGAFERLAALLDKVAPSPELSEGLACAIGWLRWDDVELSLEALLAEDGPPELRSAGVSGAVLHYLDPGDVLAAGLASPHTGLVRAALRAAGALGRVDLLPVVRERLRAEDPEERWWAAWSAARLGAREGREALGRLATAGGPRAAEALEVAVRCSGGEGGPELVEAVAACEGTERATLVGLAAIGDRGALDALLLGLRDPALARLAAYCVSVITGLVVPSAERLAADESEASPPEDADDPDVFLPWPDGARLEAAARAKDLAGSARWLDGRPPHEAALGALIARRDAPNHLRRAAALELAALDRARPLVDTSRRARPGRRSPSA